MTPAGRRDKQITLQRRQSVRNGIGEATGEWLPISPPVWAKLEHLPGGETFSGQQFVATGRVTFTILHAPAVSDLRATDRVTLRGQAYDITDVRILGRNREIEFDATLRRETVPDGG